MTIGDKNHQNDRAIGSGLLRPPANLPDVPNDGDTLVWSAAANAYVSVGGVQSYTYVAIDDAGDGSPHGDINATDFTGQTGAVGSAAAIALNGVVTFIHKATAYSWVGPRPVTVGVGGNHTVVAADLAGAGTADHNSLVNKDAPDGHPTSAITGLDADQAAQDAATAQVASDLAAHVADDTDPHNVQHSQLSDAGDPNLHPISSISGLAAEQTAQDAATAQVQSNLDTHEAAPDPHPQYATVSGALSTFTAAGYGGVRQSAPVGLPNLGAGYTLIPADVAIVSGPKGVTQDPVNDGLRILAEGVWLFNVNLSLEHNSSNNGRSTLLQLWNATDGDEQASVPIFVGRNAEGFTIGLSLLAQIPPDDINDLLQFRLGGGDSFTSVTLQGYNLATVHVSEAQFLL